VPVMRAERKVKDFILKEINHNNYTNVSCVCVLGLKESSGSISRELLRATTDG
jgi:hypothetical protein